MILDMGVLWKHQILIVDAQTVLPELLGDQLVMARVIAASYSRRTDSDQPWLAIHDVNPFVDCLSGLYSQK